MPSTTTDADLAGDGMPAARGAGRRSTSRLGHRDGCPADPTRVETFDRTTPPSADGPSRKVTVTRCCDCGSQQTT